MARTPVVIQGPPKGGPRKPVVVRPGPEPKDKGAILDATFGIVGALLLVLAVALFSILPEDVEPTPQWNVSYTESVTQVSEVQSFDFVPEQTHLFTVPFDASNVHAVSFVVEFTDDIASSLPDEFAFQLIGPDGESLGDEVLIANPPPTTDGSPVAPAFTANTVQHVFTAQLAKAPSNGPQPYASPSEDLPNAQARIQDATNTVPAGEWALEARLVRVGGCPDPTGDPGRALTCQAATGQQGDTGNSAQLVRVTFTTYDAVVTS